MRIVLIGAVDSTRVALEVLAEHGIPPVALATLPPERARRHSDYVDLEPLAASLGVPTLPAVNVNAPETLDALRALRPDYLMVIGWSQICGTELLGVARHGAIGYHPAALPKHRGRAVIPWTILLGCERTGSTLFWLDEGMDSGDIVAQEEFEVDAAETAATLYEKHLAVLRRLLSGSLPSLLAGQGPRSPQDHSQAVYCAKRTAADGHIDWQRPAAEIWTLIRAVGKPYPGAFSYVDGRRLTIWEADYVGAGPYVGLPGQVQRLTPEGAYVQCGDGEHLLLRSVQVEDEPPAPAGSVLKVHARLGIDWLSLLNP